MLRSAATGFLVVLSACALTAATADGAEKQPSPSGCVRAWNSNVVPEVKRTVTRLHAKHASVMPYAFYRVPSAAQSTDSRVVLRNSSFTCEVILVGSGGRVLVYETVPNKPHTKARLYGFKAIHRVTMTPNATVDSNGLLRIGS